MIFYILFSSVVLQAVTSELSSCPAINPLEVCQLRISRNLIPSNEYQVESTCRKLRSYYDCVIPFLHNFPSYELCGWSLVLKHAEDILMSYCKDQRVTMPEYLYLESFYCFRSIMDRYSKVCKSAAEFLYDVYEDSSSRKNIFVTNKNNSQDCAKGIIESECYTFYITHHCRATGILIFYEISSLSHFHLAFCQTGEQYMEIRRSLNILKKKDEGYRRFWSN